MESLETSRALWNRSRLALESDEVLAQVLDRGEIAAWRELYRLARTDPELRARIARTVLTVPVPLPRFWLAALADLGEPVDLGSVVLSYYEQMAPCMWSVSRAGSCAIEMRRVVTSTDAMACATIGHASGR